MKVQSICNVERVTPQAEDATWRLRRSHLGQLYDGCYPAGTIFQVTYINQHGELWLKDVEGDVVFVPLGELQCFEDA